MIEYFKVQDKGDLYRYMKANKIFNSEEPACSQRQELYSAFWQVIALQQIHSS